MDRLFFCSHSFDRLAQGISDRFESRPFDKNLIITPSREISQWLKIEFCKRSKRKAFLGIEFVQWKGAICKLAKNLVCPDHPQLIGRIWNELNEEPYKRWKVANRLAGLFLEYFWEGFEPSDWEKELYHKLFPLSLEEVLSKSEPQPVALFLFGLDALPSSVEEFFFRHEKVQEYRFSPSAMFWQDLKSPKEQRWLIRKLQKQRVKTEVLERSYEADHPLLSVWGVLGRDRKDVSGDVFEEEDFSFDETCKAALHQLQQELLLLEVPEERVQDGSLQVLRAGISRVQEVELAKRQILEAASSGIALGQIGVYVTDLAVYGPILEFVFTGSFPFRIEGGSSFRKSPFYQGVLSLFRCFETRWSADAVVELFENSCVRAKIGWSEEESLLLKEWIRKGSIRWALDSDERGKQEGCWKYGIDQIAEGWFYLKAEKETLISWSEFEPLERFLGTLEILKKRFCSWKEEKSSLEWHQTFSELIGDVLFQNGEEESVVQDFLAALKNGDVVQKYPFFYVRKLFDHFGENGSGGAALHGVRCAELKKEGPLPADWVIILGLDEESHPRKRMNDSLDQRPYSKLRDEDRYALLKSIFAARKALYFIYRDLSEEDGKEMGPSLILQELLDHLQQIPQKVKRLKAYPTFSFLQSAKELRESSAEEVSLEELLRFYRNSIGFYLEQTLGIDLGKELESGWEEFELPSFECTKLLKKHLGGVALQPEDRWPLGLFGEELQGRLSLQLEDWKEMIDEYQIDLGTLNSCQICLEGVTGDAWGIVDGGILYYGTDQIGGYLRRWPELVAALAQTNSRKIFPLKGKKTREVENPKEALQKLKRFYLKYKDSLVPLHPEWIDPMLRKNASPDGVSKDRVLNWALNRSPEWDLEAEKVLWEAELRETLEPLLDLFPQRKEADAEI